MFIFFVFDNVENIGTQNSNLEEIANYQVLSYGLL